MIILTKMIIIFLPNLPARKNITCIKLFVLNMKWRWMKYPNNVAKIKQFL